MATKPTVTYSGPRTFRAEKISQLGEMLERAFNAVDSAVRKLADGGPLRWQFTETLRGNGVVRPNVALECDTVTTATITVTLPPPDPRDIGLECGIVRLSAAGTITMFPIDGATLDGATSSQAVPATAGFYVLGISPRGYWLRR